MNPRDVLIRLLLALCLVACLIWLALCLLMVPVLMCVKIRQRKAAT